MKPGIADRPPVEPRRAAMRIALVYACFGVLWIVLSDLVLGAFIANQERMILVQIVKGATFILLTAALVYWLVRSYAAAVLQSGSEREKSEQGYRRIVETASEGICSVDTAGSLVLANARFANLVGYTAPDELLGRPLLTLVDPDSRHELAGRLQDDAGASQKPLDVKLRDQSGKEVWTLAALSPLFDEGHCRVGSLLLFTDISERKRLESQLVQFQKMEAIGQLAGGIAHDFNNIVTAILGNVDLMRLQLKRTPLPVESLAADIDQVERAGERAMALTRQLLAFSRRQVTRPEIVQPAALLADMEQMLTRLIREDIQLQIQAAENTPAVRADASQFEQVVINLVVNARDAMPAGGKLNVQAAEVMLDSNYAALHPDAREGRHLMIAVSDTGHGMDRQTLERVFEPFFTTKPAGKGTGLGLATVYGIVKQFGGHVTVYSEPNVGTTFRVYLPAAEGATPQAAPGKRVEGASGGDETILVCEDSEAIRSLAARLLEQKGYQVLAAESSETALTLAEQHAEPIHLLITDVVMAGLSGPDLAEQLVARRPEMKVLYMSGYTSDMIAQQGLVETGSNFLAKPFTSEQLWSKVRQVLDATSPPKVGN